jgi:predicted polyphosphate/ATP-dependent NAD kinase
MVQRKTIKLGFLINPIAGMGGRVGLKGTDGVLAEALDRGAEPVAQSRALEAINRYITLSKESQEKSEDRNTAIWFTCAGEMGFDVLSASVVDQELDDDIKVVFTPDDKANTTAEDTKRAVEEFLKAGVELILFCGGDGTARDVYSVVKTSLPILGIPSGVKMHSGVFATHAKYAGELLVDYLKGEMDTAEGEILDLDEDRYRAGEWNIRLFGVAKTPYEPTIIQRGKHMVETASEAEIKEEIAEFIREEIAANPDTLYILGSGSTVDTITKHLGIDGTLLGIDAVFGGNQCGKDLNEQSLLELLAKHPKAKLIVSPIGAQGFILGRGNLQLSPALIRKLGVENIEVVSTPAKLAGLEVLRVDTNDPELDTEFAKAGWLKVIVRYREMKLKKVVV